jgi:copper resistance protein B
MKSALLLAGLFGVAAAQEHTHHPPPPARTPARTERVEQPREPIPPLTDADRAAAFPEIDDGHAAHGAGLHWFLQVDQLEAWREDEENGLAWEVRGWTGGDLHKAWVRSEGARFAGSTDSSDVELLYGRAVAPWWNLVAGIQHDFRPGDSQTFAGIGLIGLAPHRFELEATAYVGESGQTRATLDAEYELLFTNRLILQPLVEVTLHGKDDESRGIGAGLSTVEAGLRLRYEVTRRFAPYVGVVYERAVSQTADFRRAAGEEAHDTLAVAGVRTWF